MRIRYLLMVMVMALFVVNPVVAKEPLHSPIQVIQFLTKSPLTYDVKTVKELEMTAEPFTSQIDNGGRMVTAADGKVAWRTFADLYGDNPAYVEHLRQAEKLFQEKKYTAARQAYLQVLETAPEQSQVMTFIAQTWRLDGDPGQAETWFRKAIATSYADYLAHWGLANILWAKDEREAALDEMIIALILNRNNPRILDSLRGMSRDMGREYGDWEFRPRYALSRKADGSIRVEVSKEGDQWMSYALCKALWVYEPGFKERMLKQTKYGPWMAEERDCVFAGMLGEQNQRKSVKGRKPSPEFAALKRAVKTKHFDDYIFFELGLRQNPELARQFTSDEKIAPLVAYVREIRLQKK